MIRTSGRGSTGSGEGVLIVVSTGVGVIFRLGDFRTPRRSESKNEMREMLMTGGNECNVGRS